MNALEMGTLQSVVSRTPEGELLYFSFTSLKSSKIYLSEQIILFIFNNISKHTFQLFIP